MDFFINLWDLSLSLAPYLLLGSLAAGLLHVWLPEDSIRNHLGSRSYGSVLKAALFGIPLPFCSCSVVPFAVSLKRSGASDGAVVSFLIATPITGVDSIAATYGVFGWVFTLYRVLTSFVMAIMTGVLVNFFATPVAISLAPEGETVELKRASGFSLKKALDYGFNTVFKDIARPLAVGIVLGAAIMSFVPAEWGSLAAKYYLLAYAAVLLIAPPLYICATSSIPVAASLVAVGFPLGAAFVLLTAGPATSTVTMSVIFRHFGARVLAIYLSVIILSSLAFGIGLDMLLSGWIPEPASLLHLHETSGLLMQGWGVLFAGVLAYYLIIEPLRPKKKSSCCSDSCGCGH